MLCAAFVNGKVIAVSIEKGGALPAAATRFLRGPEGKKAAPSPGALQAILKPGLFLSNLATETGLRIDSTERDVLAALGSPQELPSAQPPFRFIYRSSRENDPACPGRCSGTYTLKSEHLMAIFLQAE